MRAVRIGLKMKYSPYLWFRWDGRLINCSGNQDHWNRSLAMGVNNFATGMRSKRGVSHRINCRSWGLPLYHTNTRSANFTRILMLL